MRAAAQQFLLPTPSSFATRILEQYKNLQCTKALETLFSPALFTNKSDTIVTIYQTDCNVSIRLYILSILIKKPTTKHRSHQPKPDWGV